jgi:prepilin-type N-terminal cleavage/methylation domain-containing protein
MLKQFKKHSEGFTIIEVLIVLAIAGLILLVVFLAVPALQRSQRNSARKTDASRLAASIVDFTSNSATGALPTTQAQCNSILASAANLAQYSSLGATCNATVGTTLPATPTANNMYLETMAANGTAGTPTTNVVILATQAQCNATNDGVTFTSAGSRSTALLYTLESGNNWAWACLNPQ